MLAHFHGLLPNGALIFIPQEMCLGAKCDGRMVRSRFRRNRRRAVWRRLTPSRRSQRTTMKAYNYCSDKLSQKGTHTHAPACAPTDAVKRQTFTAAAAAPPRANAAAAAPHSTHSNAHIQISTTFSCQVILATHGHMTQHESPP